MRSSSRRDVATPGRGPDADPTRRTESRIMRDRIREILRTHAHVVVGPDQLSDDADLYQAGLTSHASVNLMLALEDEFEVEVPESFLLRRTFESVSAIEDALQKIGATSNAA